MTVTDKDRAKAHALWNELLCNGGVPGWSALDTIAAARAAERAAADQLRADVLALADELDKLSDDPGEGIYAEGAYADAAARLRAIAGGQS